MTYQFKRIDCGVVARGCETAVFGAAAVAHSREGRHTTGRPQVHHEVTIGHTRSPTELFQSLTLFGHFFGHNIEFAVGKPRLMARPYPDFSLSTRQRLSEDQLRTDTINVDHIPCEHTFQVGSVFDRLIWVPTNHSKIMKMTAMPKIVMARVTTKVTKPSGGDSE